MLLAAGCIYGLMAYLSQSILPSLLLHFLGDLLLFGLRASVTASTRRVSA
jgi:membrane protease YdiL (CAAX protease family)